MDFEYSKVRSITTNQNSLYKDLKQVVQKYANTCYLRPIALHTHEAFIKTKEFVESFYNKKKPYNVILDSGCGLGESSWHISKKFPNFPVIGIDKSAKRLEKHSHYESNLIQKNVFLIRAELLDFWRLALDEVKQNNWIIPYHALFFPNPWPKQNEATRRFHLHPIFPTLLELSNSLECRTNWEIYAKEFTEASQVYFDLKNKKASIKCSSYETDSPETAFERKYKESNQKLWQVKINQIRDNNEMYTLLP